MPGKMKFRLKAGSHSEGVGAEQKVYKANDPANCIVESDQDLAAFDPNKFEPYVGPLRSRGLRGAEITAGGIQKDPPPPPTPDEFARAEAAARTQATRPMSVDVARKRAEEMRRQADDLEHHAEETERALMETMKDEEDEEGEEHGEQSEEDAEEAQLEELKVQELRDLAESEKIDLKGSMTKADIIKTIRQSRKDKPPEQGRPETGK